MIRREEVRDRLVLNAPLAERALTAFVRDAVGTAGAKGVVVGLSGGVDSALAAALGGACVSAPIASTPFTCPTATSSPDARTPRRGDRGGFRPARSRPIDITPRSTPTSRSSPTPTPCGAATRWRASA